MGTNRIGKRGLFERLAKSGNVTVHLNPRGLGVQVPMWCSDQEHLALCVGYNMRIPIPDLTCDEAGISGTLVFSGKRERCVLPWSSVFALVGRDDRGMVWIEDLPASLVELTQASSN